MKHWDFTEINQWPLHPAAAVDSPSLPEIWHQGGIILQSVQRLLNEIKASLSCRGGQPFTQCSARCLSRGLEGAD